MYPKSGASSGDPDEICCLVRINIIYYDKNLSSEKEQNFYLEIITGVPLIL